MFSVVGGVNESVDKSENSDECEITPHKNKRKRRSDIWLEFAEVYLGKERKACCSYCKALFSANGGTSHLKRHLQLCPRRVVSEKTQKLLSFPSSTSNAKVKFGRVKVNENVNVNVNDQRVDNVDAHGNFIEGEIRSHKSRGKKRSEIWLEFTEVYLDKKRKACCNHCKLLLSYGGLTGTSHLKRHLQSCRRRVGNDKTPKLHSLALPTSNVGSLNLSSWKFDHEHARQELARMIIIHEYPFSILNHDGFQRFVQSLNPRFKLVARDTIRNDCMELFKKERASVTDFLKTTCERVSLNVNLWTANQTLGYMSLTAHFIDNDWKLQKRILRFCTVEIPHNALDLFTVISDSLKSWNLENKVLSVTLDNAVVDDTLVGLLVEHFLAKNSLKFGGTLVYVPCAARVLNLVVGDGLHEIEGIINNVRDSVKYLEGSPSRLQIFERVAQEVGVSIEKGLCSDVRTRWNSTYFMLESALRFRKVFHSLQFIDSEFRSAPSMDDWDKAEVVSKFLKTFFNAMKVVSGSKHPTANVYFHEIWKVKALLYQESVSTHGFIRNMVDRMQEKFDKYWKICSLVITIPVILDPRYKLKYLEFRFSRVYGSEASYYIQNIKEAIRTLFNEYTNLSSTQSEERAAVKVEKNVIDTEGDGGEVQEDWDRFLHEEVNRQKKTELDKYLDESVVPCSTLDFDILSWWKSNVPTYPTLAQMSRDILAIPVSTVTSESAFSAEGRALSHFRRSLSGDVVEALVCTQDWLRCKDDLGGSSFASIYDVDDDILPSES